jgi:hypothetical protein
MSKSRWILLAAALFALSGGFTAQAQSDQVLPPPPGTASVQQPVTPSKSPVQSPTQSPMQAAVQSPAVPQTVTCTVMMPQVSYKTVTVPAVQMRPEQRQQEITVCRMVPETQMMSCTATVMVPEQRTAQQTFNVCRMTFETAQRQVTVMVPRMETRVGTRTVCKPVAVQTTQTICRDAGSWQTQSYTDCCGCTHSCQVWVPNMVTQQVPVTVYQPQMMQEQFNYNIVTLHPQQQTINEQVAKPVFETQTREVNYFVPVAKQIEQQIPRTTFKQVTENRTVNYTVMVPERVERQVQVPVCTMVPKQVTYMVPPCGPCGW